MENNSTYLSESAIRQINNLSKNQNHTNSILIVNQATLHVPVYDGYSMSLQDYLQDIDNGLTLITDEQEPIFLRTVIARLKGKAKLSLIGKSFANVEELKQHLRNEFSPVKPSREYMTDLMNTSMKQNENLRTFHHRLVQLIEQSLSAMVTELKITDNNIKKIQRKQLENLALQVFINGLPDEWKPFIAHSRPQTLDEALETALISENTSYKKHNDQPKYIYKVVPTTDQNTSTVQNSNQKIIEIPVEIPVTQQEVKKQVEFTDPLINNRNSIPYRYNKNDFKRNSTEYDEYGRIIAHPALSYAYRHNDAHIHRPITPPNRPRTPQPPQQPYQYPPYPYPNYYPPPPHYSPYFAPPPYYPPPPQYNQMPQPYPYYPNPYPIPYNNYNQNSNNRSENSYSRPSTPKNEFETRHQDASASPNQQRQKTILNKPSKSE